VGDSKRRVVLASRNPDKVSELRQILDDSSFEVVSSADYPGLPEVIEDGTTILGNATRKALLTAAYTGEISVADDTSLEIQELNGFPDIFAARFSGPGATYSSNAELVLDLMETVPKGSRQARFATACVWIDPRPDPGQYNVAAPAARRWLRNPWSRSIGIRSPEREWDYWNSILDRRDQWAQYVRSMKADLVTRGHEPGRLAEIADGLFATCPDAGGAASGEAGVRLPDPRIWAVTGPEEAEAVATVVAPSGLDAAAPGRAVNGPCWLEISTEGRLVGQITRQPLGSAGFGYDPVFRPTGQSRTLAEMEAGEKHAISHRGRAMRRLLQGVRAAY